MSDMSEVVVIFLTAFIGGGLGGMLGVWLAWHRVRNEVMTRLARERTTGL